MLQHKSYVWLSVHPWIMLEVSYHEFVALLACGVTELRRICRILPSSVALGGSISWELLLKGLWSRWSGRWWRAENVRMWLGTAFLACVDRHGNSTKVKILMNENVRLGFILRDGLLKWLRKLWESLRGNNAGSTRCTQSHIVRCLRHQRIVGLHCNIIQCLTRLAMCHKKECCPDPPLLDYYVYSESCG